MIGGVRHAWSVGTAGLQLQPLEGQTRSMSPGVAVSAGDVFAGRASSPFERISEPVRSPRTEPRPGTRVRDAVGRELRATHSDPSRRDLDCRDEGTKEVGWLEQGRAELAELLARPKTGTSVVPPPPRPITPVRPRIVYPFSPEIKPPPPQRSPKRSFRSSPSPPRSPPQVPKQYQEPNTQEPMSDFKQLAVMLGEVLKTSRGSDSKVEDVKTIPELPRLEIKDAEKELAPLIAGDWIALIGPSLRDLSNTATQWWEEVLAASKGYYEKWLSVGPMERLTLSPDRPSRFKDGPYTRVEQRGISLILKAIPAHLKEELVSCRRLTCIEALSMVLTTYQPGGLNERSALLKYLTSPDPAKNVSECLRGLRRWGRWKLRAGELNISIPDATLLVAGLDRL